MIDQRSRDRLLQDRRDKGLASAMKDAVSNAVATNNAGGNANEEVLRLIVKKEDAGDTKETGLLEDISRGTTALLAAIRNISFNFPKIIQVFGKVNVGKVDELPDINVKNLNQLAPYFTSLGEQVSKMSMALAIAGKTAPVVKVNAPVIDSSIFQPLTDSLEAFKTHVSTPNNKDLIDAVERVEEAIVVLANRPTMTGSSGGGKVKSVSNPDIYGMPVVNPDGTNLGGSVPTGGATSALQTQPGVDIGDVTINNTTANAVPISGDVASAATDSGNPVKVGGKYNSTMPTYTDGQRADLQVGTRGSLKVSLFTNDANTALSALVDNADGVAVSIGSTKLGTIGRNTVFNGTSWDRMPGNTTGVFTQGAKTNNNAAPGATNIGTLQGIANAAVPTWTEGNMVAESMDLSGNQRTTLGTLISGEDQTNNLMATNFKPVASSVYTPALFAIFGTDVDLAVKASAGNIISITVSNINAAVRYLQVHNKASAPANPNVPVISLPIPAGSATAPGYLSLNRADFGDNGLYLSTGVAIGISTTEATFTAATTTEHDYFGTYI